MGKKKERRKIRQNLELKARVKAGLETALGTGDGDIRKVPTKEVRDLHKDKPN